MNPLILKDLLNMRGMLKIIVVMMIIFVICFIFTGNITVIYFSMMVFSMLTLTSIGYDTALNWDKFVLTAPVERNYVIRSKFVLMTATAVVFLILSVIITVAVYIATGNMLESSKPTATILAVFASTLIFGSIGIAAMYKFGPEVSRYIMMGAMFFVAGAFAAVYTQLGDILTFSNNAMFAIIPAVFAVCAIVMFAMYKLACNIYSKKEF